MPEDPDRIQRHLNQAVLDGESERHEVGGDRHQAEIGIRGRVHGEIGAEGLRHALVAGDVCVAVTETFRGMDVFVALEVGRRRLVRLERRAA